MSIAEFIIAVLFPPIAVLLRYGFSGKVVLAMLLTLVGWLPGVIYAIITLSKEPHMRSFMKH